MKDPISKVLCLYFLAFLLEVLGRFSVYIDCASILVQDHQMLLMQSSNTKQVCTCAHPPPPHSEDESPSLCLHAPSCNRKNKQLSLRSNIIKASGLIWIHLSCVQQHQQLLCADLHIRLQSRSIGK